MRYSNLPPGGAIEGATELGGFDDVIEGSTEHVGFDRGAGGSKHKDTIENLMAVCRPCHIFHGERKESLQFLKDIHNENL